MADSAVLEAIARLVCERCGLEFAGARRELLARRVAKRQEELRLDDPAAYLSRLAAVPGCTGEMRELVNRLTVHETFFLRHAPHYDFVASTVARAAAGRLRLLSCGCATGEEPYSLALALWRALPDPAAVDVSIIGADLSTEALATADAGWYADNSRALKDVPAALLGEGFIRDGEGWRIRPELRRWVTFRRLNLCDEDPAHLLPPGERFDMIFCCNVLIYFPAPLQQQCLRKLREALRPGGWLAVSPTETLRDCGEPFSRVPLAGGSVWQRQEAATPLPPAPAYPVPSARSCAPVPAAPVTELSSPLRAVTDRSGHDLPAIIDDEDVPGSVDRLRAALQSALAAADDQARLALDGVRFLGPDAIACLHDGARAAHAQGATLCLAVDDQALCARLHRAGLGTVAVLSAAGQPA